MKSEGNLIDQKWQKICIDRCRSGKKTFLIFFFYFLRLYSSSSFDFFEKFPTAPSYTRKMKLTRNSKLTEMTAWTNNLWWKYSVYWSRISRALEIKLFFSSQTQTIKSIWSHQISAAATGSREPFTTQIHNW